MYLGEMDFYVVADSARLDDKLFDTCELMERGAEIAGISRQAYELSWDFVRRATSTTISQTSRLPGWICKADFVNAQELNSFAIFPADVESDIEYNELEIDQKNFDPAPSDNFRKLSAIFMQHMDSPKLPDAVVAKLAPSHPDLPELWSNFVRLQRFRTREERILERIRAQRETKRISYRVTIGVWVSPSVCKASFTHAGFAVNAMFSRLFPQHANFLSFDVTRALPPFYTATREPKDLIDAALRPEQNYLFSRYDVECDLAIPPSEQVPKHLRQFGLQFPSYSDYQTKPFVGDDLTDEQLQQLSGIDVPLRDYQLQTIRWMLHRELRCRSFFSDFFCTLQFPLENPTPAQWMTRKLFERTRKGRSPNIVSSPHPIRFEYSPLFCSLRFRPLPLIRGGMLCEEMGLGLSSLSIFSSSLTCVSRQNH